MGIAWRQGDLLAPADAYRLGLIFEPNVDCRALVISHSCDIAADNIVEPEVELIIGNVVTVDQAKFSNGHSIRSLNLLAVNASGVEEAVLLRIHDRKTVAKTQLADCVPWPEVRYEETQRRLLQRWLVQRYCRSEFPDAFVAWLNERGVEQKLEQIAKRESKVLSGIYFDLDDHSERSDPAEPYELGIQLVYASDNTEAPSRAEMAATQLTAAFRECCLRNEAWTATELLYCNASSDQAFSLHAANAMRRWRLEHRSLHGEPINQPE